MKYPSTIKCECAGNERPSECLDATKVVAVTKCEKFLCEFCISYHGYLSAEVALIRRENHNNLVYCHGCNEEVDSSHIRVFANVQVHEDSTTSR